tara:strand:+ start:16678 stop:17445 length:768 start_codon:yes stop_codon:yes gene_type:complete
MNILNYIEIHSVDHCTLSCNYCSHDAENADVKSYSAEDYDRWFDKLTKKGILFDNISIAGGEPLINKKLPELISMSRRYTNQRVATMTNGWWLSSDNSVRKQADRLVGVDDLCVTIYRPYVEKFGGLSAVEERLDYLQELMPGLNIVRWGQRIVRDFGKIEFTNEKKDTVPDFYCAFMGCKQLLHTGILLGCCASRRVISMPAVDKFSIQADFSKEEFVSWYNKNPLDLCNHCSIGTEGVTYVEWTQKKKDNNDK